MQQSWEIKNPQKRAQVKQVPVFNFVTRFTFVVSVTDFPFLGTGYRTSVAGCLAGFVCVLEIFQVILAELFWCYWFLFVLDVFLFTLLG